MEGPLTSDFSAARIHLERAYHYLRGNDETSRLACEALDLHLDQAQGSATGSRATGTPAAASRACSA